MDGLYWTRRWKRLTLCGLLFCPILFLRYFWTLLSLSTLWGYFFFAGFCIVLAFALFSTLIRGKATASPIFEPVIEPVIEPMVLGEGLPSIPRTLPEVYSMGPAKFEIFSAAILVAMGEGHRFLAHCGQSGDEGIDVKLLNLYHNTVVVQCKLYAPNNHVGQPELRDFLGSILYHQAVYGFFVTTSTFTPAARQLINNTHGRIRPIDGRRLESLLQYRSREIALALQDVLNGEQG